MLWDMMHRINPQASLFYLDTDFLFPETHAVRDRLMDRYKVPGRAGDPCGAGADARGASESNSETCCGSGNRINAARFGKSIR